MNKWRTGDTEISSRSLPKNNSCAPGVITTVLKIISIFYGTVKKIIFIFHSRKKSPSPQSVQGEGDTGKRAPEKAVPARIHFSA